jgi:hypothetical protein
VAVAGSQATRLRRYALAVLRARYSGFALEEPGMAWLGQDVSSGFALGQYLRQRQAGSATLLALRACGAWRRGVVYTTIKWSGGRRDRGGATRLRHYALAALRARYSGFALKEPGVAWLGQAVSLGFALGQYLRQRQAGSATRSRRMAGEGGLHNNQVVGGWERWGWQTN